MNTTNLRNGIRLNQIDSRHYVLIFFFVLSDWNNNDKNAP
jgi:hypothetical protein